MISRLEFEKFLNNEFRLILKENVELTDEEKKLITQLCWISFKAGWDAKVL